MSLSVSSIHPRPGNHELETRLLGLVDGFRQRRVVVVGDVFAEEYVHGQVSKVSGDAPVLVVDYEHTTVRPGGAGNAATQVAGLDGQARLVGILGSDDVGRRVARAFPPGVDKRRLTRLRAYHTPVRTRVMARGLQSVSQQIVRIDRHASAVDKRVVATSIEQAAGQAALDCDAVLVSDHGSGLVTAGLVTALTQQVAKRSRRLPVPVLVDSRHNPLHYHGPTICTLNESGAETALDVTIGDHPKRLERAGRAILRRTRAKAVVLTRGGKGISLFETRQRTTHFPVIRTAEVNGHTGAGDTGAGDTVSATLALALAAGASFYEAARLAAYGAGLLGPTRDACAVSSDELRRAVTVDLNRPL